MKTLTDKNPPGRGWKSNTYGIFDGNAHGTVVGTMIKMADQKYSVSMAGPSGHTVEIFDTLLDAKRWAENMA